MIRQDGNLYLSQPGLIAKMVIKAGLPEKIRYFGNPMREDFSDAFQDDAPACSQEDYRSLLGMLIYVLRTRPDVAYAVNRMATRSIGATERDLDAVKRIVAYLRCTAHLELVYSAQDESQRRTIGELHARSDAAYLCHRDSKSHSGICFTYGEPNTGAFFSSSKKQTTVSTSSTEAEANAAFDAAKYIMFFRDLLKELGYPQLEPTTLWVDNMSLITLATAFSGSTKNVKHYMMRVNFLIEKVAAGIIKLEYIPTLKNTSDTLTKNLGVPLFAEHTRSLLGGPQRLIAPVPVGENILYI
jgi:hypothetical protein